MSERLGFHRSLYDPQAVRAAADAYLHLARVEVIEEGDEVLATFIDIDPELADVLLDAFANHVLHETVIRSRGAL